MLMNACSQLATSCRQLLVDSSRTPKKSSRLAPMRLHELRDVCVEVCCRGALDLVALPALDVGEHACIAVVEDVDVSVPRASRQRCGELDRAGEAQCLRH